MIKLQKMNTLRQMTDCSVATEKEANFLLKHGWALVVEPVKKPKKTIKKLLSGDK